MFACYFLVFLAISLVFSYIPSITNENSNITLRTMFPTIRVIKKARKLVEIKPNDDRVMYIASMMYNAFKKLVINIFLNFTKS